MTEKTEKKYPYDIFSSITKTKSFSIEAHLTQETESTPLKIFHKSFSRFVFVTADLTKTENKAAVCNIHPSDIPMIAKKTDYAFNKYMDETNVALSSEESGNIAYTRRFKAGTLSGKSPADVLIENGEKGIDILKKQYSWLEENLSKYKSNKELMDAITEALKLNINELKNNNPSVSTVSPVNIFTLSTRPLTRKKREDGKCFCYEAKIDYIPGNKYPIVVTVENYYAPVRENENGTLNVQLSSKDMSSVINNQVFLSFEDWLDAVEQMKSIIDLYKSYFFSSAVKASEQMAKELRENAISQEPDDSSKEVVIETNSGNAPEIVSIEIKTDGPVEDSTNDYKKIHILDSEGNDGFLVFDKAGRDSLGNNWEYIVENAPNKQIKISVKAEKKGNFYKFISRI